MLLEPLEALLMVVLISILMEVLVSMEDLTSTLVAALALMEALTLTSEVDLAAL